MRHILYFTIFVLSLTSCKKTNTVTSNFDENITIGLTETFDSTKRSLLLNIATEKIYSCSNNSINTSVNSNGSTIDITFINLVFPDICLTSLGPASTQLTFDNLQNGQYVVKLIFLSGTVTGQLNVTSNNYTLTFPTSSKVKVVNPSLYKVPSNTVFGKIHYHNATTANTVQTFIDSLNLLGATSKTYLPGDYGYFKIDSNGSVFQNQDLGYYFTRYFIFDYSNSSSVLKQLTKSYGNRFPDSLLIILNTSKGESFMSWIK